MSWEPLFKVPYISALNWAFNMFDDLDGVCPLRGSRVGNLFLNMVILISVGTVKRWNLVGGHWGHCPRRELMLISGRELIPMRAICYDRASLAPSSLSGFLSHHVIVLPVSLCDLINQWSHPILEFQPSKVWAK